MYNLNKIYSPYKDDMPTIESASYDPTKKTLAPRQYYLLKDTLSLIEKLEDNWDGNGSKAASKSAIELSRAFIDLINFRNKFPDKVSTNGEGDIVFVWNLQDERLVLSVESFQINLSHEYPGGKVEFKNDIPFDGYNIPRNVIEHLPPMKSK